MTTTWRPRRSWRAVLLLLFGLPLAAPALAAEEGEGPALRRLRVEPLTTGLVAGGSLALVLTDVALGSPLAPDACRLCEPGAFDRRAREGLRWPDTAAARKTSDALVVAVPALAVGAIGWLERRDGDLRGFGEQAVVVAEAVSVTLLATQVAKAAFGRQRPYAWAGAAPSEGQDDVLSLWSGHTATAFSAVTSAATAARLRGHRGWRWILGAGLVGATAVGWLRVAADRHWATDVLAGAAVGSAIGLGLPVWLHGPEAPAGGRALSVLVLPNGVVGTFD